MSLSDEQLLEQCEFLPWERRLHEWTWSWRGCGTSLLFAGACIWLAYRLGRPFLVYDFVTFFLIGAGLMLAPLAFFQMDDLAERRRNRYWAELQRRYAGAAPDTYVNQIQAETATAGAEPPDLALVLAGHALPHGGTWLVRVVLRPDGCGKVERRTLQPGRLDGVGKDLAGAARFKGSAPLSPNECDEVRTLVDEALAAGPKVSVMSEVMDGSPAELAVYRRGSGVVLRADCNLCGVPERHKARPAIRLMLLADRLGRKVVAPHTLIGSCNALTGEVRVGGM